jgi:hypothetical protein
MAARGMGAIVPATGATGMAPIAAVGGKANSPIGKVCPCLCCLASSFEMAIICQATLTAPAPASELLQCGARHEVVTTRWRPKSAWMYLRM